ncbi:MAG: ABC transporter ATP-binding protein, partial [Bacteroidota bacterium]
MNRIFKDNAAPFWQLLSYIRPFRKDYIAATIYSVLNKMFDLMPEVLLGIAVNTVVEKEYSWLATFGIYNLKVQLLLLGFTTFIVYGLESLFEYLYSIKWGHLAQHIQHNFRVDAFKHVQQSTMEAFSSQKTGNVLAILNEDINQLERFFKEDIDEIIELVCTVLFVGGIFVFISPQIALFAMLPIPLILQGAFFFHRKLGPLYLVVREQAGMVSAQLANSLLGWFTVKSLVGEAVEANKVAQVSNAYREVNLDAIWWEALVGPVIRFIILLGYLVTLVHGGFLAIEGRLDVGAYSTLIFMTQR